MSTTPVQGLVQYTLWDRARRWLGLTCRACKGTGQVPLHLPPWFVHCTVSCPCGQSSRPA